ncbi:MAG TPA: radical SAM/SPASM domain-containing protein [Arcobacter sp.]|nr:radical SAM/SPASM domain-containing protein [Arcobacter sp.]
MKFNKVYIELTNICGLSCDFCPTKTLQNQTISIEDFEDILKQVSLYTNIITFHVFGDPLVLKNLSSYLDIASKYKLKVELVTTGYYLNNFPIETFLHDAIKQINFSINSYNKNDMKMTLQNYLKPMIELSYLKLKQKKQFFINFRLWNLDKNSTENEFNNKVYKILSQSFDIDLSGIDESKSIRLENKVLIDFDEYFEWPNLNSTHNSNATCYGLKSHFAILASGKVVPCCLDSFGCIDLGNIFDTSLDTILNQKRTQDIIEGFKNNIAVEELCQKCTFKDRFKKKNT